MLFHSLSTKLLPVHTLLYSAFSSLPLFCLWVNLVLKSLIVFRLTEQYYKTFKGGRSTSPILFLSVSLCLLFQMVLPTTFFFPRKALSSPFGLLLFKLGPVQLSSNPQYSITVICILFHTASFPSCCLLPFFWCLFIILPVLFPSLSHQS